MKTVVTILILVVSTVGPCAVIAAVGHGAMLALGRNPSAAPKIQTSMLLAFLFAESIAVVSLLVIFQLFAR